jgi:hypothetical protein
MIPPKNNSKIFIISKFPAKFPKMNFSKFENLLLKNGKFKVVFPLKIFQKNENFQIFSSFKIFPPNNVWKIIFFFISKFPAKFPKLIFPKLKI